MKLKLKLKAKLNKLKSRYSHHYDVIVLVSGTASGQVIGFAALPFITRLYGPTEFSVLAIYTAIVSICASVAGLRLELAIPIPESDTEGMELLAASMISTCFIATIFGVVIAVGVFSGILDQINDQLRQFVFWVPLSVLFSGAYQNMQYWHTRKKNFLLITSTRIQQSVGSASSQIVLGAGGYMHSGLIVGQIFASSLGLRSFLSKIVKNDKNLFVNLQVANIYKSALKFRDYPKYSTLEALANHANVQLPILAIAYFGNSAQLGYIALSMKVMAAPLALLGTAVTQVFLSTAASHERKGNTAENVVRSIAELFKYGVGPIVFMGIVAPSVFPVLLGEQWIEAGNLVMWMTPWFALQFMVSPISISLHVANGQKKAMLLQIVGLILRTGSVVVVAMVAQEYVGEAYSLSGFLFYGIYIIVVMNHLAVKMNTIGIELARNIWVPTIWVALAMVIRYLW